MEADDPLTFYNLNYVDHLVIKEEPDFIDLEMVYKDIHIQSKFARDQHISDVYERFEDVFPYSCLQAMIQKLYALQPEIDISVKDLNCYYDEKQCYTNDSLNDLDLHNESVLLFKESTVFFFFFFL